MKTVGYVFAGLLIALGALCFFAAAQAKPLPRCIAGAVLLGAGLAVIYFLRMKLPDQQVTVNQNLQLSGEVKLEQMKCRNCGAPLDSKSVSVQAGAVFANCPYCKASYQLEEAPKW